MLISSCAAFTEYPLPTILPKVRLRLNNDPVNLCKNKTIALTPDMKADIELPNNGANQ